MVNVRHVLIGWGKKWGILPTSEAERKLSELRLTICRSCPDHKVSKELKFLEGDGAEYVSVIFCTRCKCPCEAKTLVIDETCPIKKW